MRSKKTKDVEKAAQEEMDSHKKNMTWDLIEKPDNQKLVGCKWIFKIKPCIAGLRM